MQSKQEKTTDARTFVEIYQSLSRSEREWLIYKINTTVGVTRQSVWQWGKGICQPLGISAKRDVAKIVSSMLNIKTSPTILFH